jgi:transposase
VRIKSIEQQALQGLHRTRSLRMTTRTARINALRGFCRELGIVIAQGESPRRRGDRPRACRSALGSADAASSRTHLGRISKRGDRYLRMLLTHGARSVLRAASVAAHAGKTVDGLRQWALAVQQRSNHNKATCALAN